MFVTPEECQRFRSLLGWSPEQLAREAGLTVRTIVDFEAGRRNPRIGTLVALKRLQRAVGQTPTGAPE